MEVLNIAQELNYIKELAKDCKNTVSKNNIFVACDNVLKMCNDTFNGYCTENLELHERLDKYKNLEDQGLLLKLPCNVGTTVYTINKLQGGKTVISELEVSTFLLALSVLEERWGKSIFLTQAEAEEARKKMS